MRVRHGLVPLVLALTGLLGTVLASAPASAASVSVSTATQRDHNAGAAKAGSCKGFKKRIGITKKQIRIGNASDLSGPTPGGYTDALLATQAFAAYFNKSRRICGRKLAVYAYDSQANADADKNAYTKQCTRVFASVGSMSAEDAGGAKTAQACRLPDLRAASISSARNACTTCFGTNATGNGEAPNSVPDYVVSRHPDAATKTAQLYLNVPSTATRATTLARVWAARGVTYISRRAVDIAEFNYGPYVQAMKNEGAAVVQFVGPRVQATRLAQAMELAGYRPTLFLVDSEAYSAEYASAGPAVQGSIVAINFHPLTSNQRELNRYRTWLKAISPESTPSPAGLYAWSATKLFAKQARSLGGKLSRASLVKRLRTIRAWTGGGLHVAQQVGTKHVSGCTRLLYLRDGRWISIGGTQYRCTGVTRLG